MEWEKGEVSRKKRGIFISKRKEDEDEIAAREREREREREETGFFEKLSLKVLPPKKATLLKKSIPLRKSKPYCCISLLGDIEQNLDLRGGERRRASSLS